MNSVMIFVCNIVESPNFIAVRCYVCACAPKMWATLAYKIDGERFNKTVFDSGSCVIAVHVEVVPSCGMRRWIVYQKHTNTVLNQLVKCLWGGGVRVN